MVNAQKVPPEKSNAWTDRVTVILLHYSLLKLATVFLKWEKEQWLKEVTQRTC